MMNKISIIIFYLFFLSSASLLARKHVFYASDNNLMSSSTFVAGDTVVLKNGEWNNKTIFFRGNGVTNNPVVFCAEEAGTVIMTGTTNCKIFGKDIEVSGLYFKGNYASSNSGHVFVFDTESQHCRLTNSAFYKYNFIPYNESINLKWISIYGTNNRVDHCYFEGKESVGSVITVWLKNNIAANHKIDHNHFYKRNSLLDSNNSTLNGQDIIRIGDSSTSMTYANCTVDNNFFEECDGEIEIISNKSCGNIYQNNVFYRCKGTLTLRHGNGCKVIGNYFIGDGHPNVGGIRVIGEDHLIYNNYFQDITGTTFRSAIAIYNGMSESPLSGYYQAKRVKVLFNTFYNCENAIYVGYNGSESLDLPPLSTDIANNVITASNSGQVGLIIGDTNSQVNITNNILYRGRFGNYKPANNQFYISCINFRFESSNNKYGIYKPSMNSILSECYRTSDYKDLIKVDIEGKLRSTYRTVGAFEINGVQNIYFQTPKTIGCSFFNK